MSTFESNPNLSPIVILEIHPEKKRQNNEAARFISTFCRSSINLSYISRRRGTIWKADWIKRTMTERKINESLFIHFYRLFVLYLWSIRRGSSRPERLFQSASLQAARNDHPHKSPGCEADVTSAWSTEPSIYGPDVESSIRRHQRRCSGSLVLLSIFFFLSFCVFFFPPQNLTFLKTRQFEGFFFWCVRQLISPFNQTVSLLLCCSPPPPVIIMEFIDLTDYQARFGLRVFVWKWSALLP